MRETMPGGSRSQLDMAPVETGFAVLRKACDRAVDDLGCAVPGAQQRALLIIDGAGGRLDLGTLAAELIASPSATSRLCDRMKAAGLLTTGSAAGSLSRPWCVLTGSGRRLASWIRGRERVALRSVLNSLGPDARDALIHGLNELAAAAKAPSELRRLSLPER